MVLAQPHLHLLRSCEDGKNTWCFSSTLNLISISSEAVNIGSTLGSSNDVKSQVSWVFHQLRDIKRIRYLLDGTVLNVGIYEVKKNAETSQSRIRHGKAMLLLGSNSECFHGVLWTDELWSSGLSTPKGQFSEKSLGMICPYLLHCSLHEERINIHCPCGKELLM